MMTLSQHRQVSTLCLTCKRTNLEPGTWNLEPDPPAPDWWRRRWRMRLAVFWSQVKWRELPSCSALNFNPFKQRMFLSLSIRALENHTWALPPPPSESRKLATKSIVKADLMSIGLLTAKVNKTTVVFGKWRGNLVCIHTSRVMSWSKSTLSSDLWQDLPLVRWVMFTRQLIASLLICDLSTDLAFWAPISLSDCL